MLCPANMLAYLFTIHPTSRERAAICKRERVYPACTEAGREPRRAPLFAQPPYTCKVLGCRIRSMRPTRGSGISYATCAEEGCFTFEALPSFIMR